MAGEYRYERVEKLFDSTEPSKLQSRELELEVGFIVSRLFQQLGPLLSKAFAWEEFEYELRVSLASAWKEGEQSTAHERFLEAQAATGNMLKALMVGKAIGSGKESDMEFAKDLVGEKESTST